MRKRKRKREGEKKGEEVRGADREREENVIDRRENGRERRE